MDVLANIGGEEERGKVVVCVSTREYRHKTLGFVAHATRTPGGKHRSPEIVWLTPEEVKQMMEAMSAWLIMQP